MPCPQGIQTFVRKDISKSHGLRGEDSETSPVTEASVDQGEVKRDPSDLSGVSQMHEHTTSPPQHFACPI